MMNRLSNQSLYFAAVLSTAILASACDGQGVATLAGPTGSLGTASPLSRTSASQSSTGGVPTEAAIRQATAAFHNIDAAFSAGYVDDGFGCIDAASFGLDPALGGMGFHLINEALHADPATDPLRPDLLVYEPQPNGKPSLVALEYEVFRDDWANAGHTEPPTLLGQPFISIDFEDIHVYALHLWLWRDNPSGKFQDFNPKVSCAR